LIPQARKALYALVGLRGLGASKMWRATISFMISVVPP
jgi:hypothetical protein